MTLTALPAKGGREFGEACARRHRSPTNQQRGRGRRSAPAASAPAEPTALTAGADRRRGARLSSQLSQSPGCGQRRAQQRQDRGPAAAASSHGSSRLTFTRLLQVPTSSSAPVPQSAAGSNSSVGRRGPKLTAGLSLQHHGHSPQRSRSNRGRSSPSCPASSACGLLPLPARDPGAAVKSFALWELLLFSLPGHLGGCFR